MTFNNVLAGNSTPCDTKYNIRCVLLLSCGGEILLQTKKGMQNADEPHAHRNLRIPGVDIKEGDDEQAALHALLLERLGLDLCPQCFRFVRMVERIDPYGGPRRLRVYRLELHPEMWAKMPDRDNKHHRLTRANRTTVHCLLHPTDVALAMAA